MLRQPTQSIKVGDVVYLRTPGYHIKECKVTGVYPGRSKLLLLGDLLINLYRESELWHHTYTLYYRSKNWRIPTPKIWSDGFIERTEIFISATRKMKKGPIDGSA